MGWRTVVVNTHSKLSYKNNHLVFQTGIQTEMIHLSEIDSIILETTNISITSMLIKRLVDEKINLVFCDDKALPLANLMPFYGRYNNSLELKKQIDWAQEKKEEVWLGVLRQKLINQSRLLFKREKDDQGKRIEEFSCQIERNDPTNREAHAARLYFNTLFGLSFSRQEETDTNAGLNYGYSLLLSIFAREIVLNGCRTELGLMHHSQLNNFNLASDLMEPFRVLVDEIVLENQEEKFKQIKKAILALVQNTYPYKGQRSYLTNIINDYVRNMIQVLNNESEKLPEFIYEL